MRLHVDERRTAFCGLFDQPGGDTNLFVVSSGALTCWHRHQKQSDQFRVIRGAIRFGQFRDGEPPTYFTVTDPEMLVLVPPDTWHGYECVSPEPAYLLMYLSRKYDAGDEERMGEGEVPWISRLTGYAPGWSDGQGSDGWGDNA